MTRVLLVCGGLLVACSSGDDQKLNPDRDGADDTSGLVPPLDSGDPRQPGGGAPSPNEQTSSTNQRCLLLFGETDRVVSDDVGFPFKDASRTMQAWVRTNWDGEQVAAAYGRGSVGQGFTMGVVGGVAFMDTNAPTRILGETLIDDDEWHHIAAVWDGNNALLVVDGVLDAFGQLEGDTQSGGFNIGNRPDASPELDPWIGWIDDVRVFGFARNPDDIAKDLDGVNEREDRLLSWFDFEVEGDVEGPNVIIEDLASDREPNPRTGESAGTQDHPKFPFCR